MFDVLRAFSRDIFYLLLYLKILILDHFVLNWWCKSYKFWVIIVDKISLNISYLICDVPPFYSSTYLCRKHTHIHINMANAHDDNIINRFELLTSYACPWGYRKDAWNPPQKSYKYYIRVCVGQLSVWCTAVAVVCIEKVKQASRRMINEMRTRLCLLWWFFQVPFLWEVFLSSASGI